MKLTSTFIFAVLALSITGCAATNSVNAANPAEEAIAAAESARKQAAEVGYEWRDTGKMIKQAQKLAAEGNTEKAMKLAKLAEEQSKDAVAQYHVEQKRYSSNH